jgi:hypothetical protein
LIEEGLAVESGKVLVEVDGEEIEVADSVLEDCVVLAVGVEELGGCFGGDGTDLSVTAGISRDEEDRYTIWLELVTLIKGVPPWMYPFFVRDIGIMSIL